MKIFSFIISDVRMNHQWTSYRNGRHLTFNNKRNTSYVPGLKVNFQRK